MQRLALGLAAFACLLLARVAAAPFEVDAREGARIHDNLLPETALRELGAIKSGNCALPEMPAAGALSRTGGAGKAPVIRRLGILGQTCSWFWRSGRGIVDSGAGSCGAWSESHGRMFTGDRSGDFLYKAMFRAGFANQPTSVRRDDGLALKNAYISATLRCAPPANKPLPSELANCRPYFERELEILRPRAVLALGGIAMRAYLGMLKERRRDSQLWRISLSGMERATICRAILPRLVRFVSSEPAEHFYRQVDRSDAGERVERHSEISGG